jgi:hypothetical protein
VLRLQILRTWRQGCAPGDVQYGEREQEP